MKATSKEKVIVSACLLGEYCRYDGLTKKEPGLIAWLSDKEVIAFCPEAPVLGTPRARIRVVRLSDRYMLLKEDDHRDVTQAIIDEANKVINDHADATCVILKSKSPSCGCQTTPIFDEKGLMITLGDGIATMQFKRVFKEIYDETNYKEIRC